jgi:hypothetical protein
MDRMLAPVRVASDDESRRDISLPPSKRPRVGPCVHHPDSDAESVSTGGDAESVSTGGDAESVSTGGDAESVSMDVDAESVSTGGDGCSLDGEERTRPQAFDRYDTLCEEAGDTLADIDDFIERVDEAYNLHNVETADGTDFFEAVESYRKEVLESQDYLQNLRDSDNLSWSEHELLHGWQDEVENVISQVYDIMEECESLLDRAKSLRAGDHCTPEPLENGLSPLQTLLRQFSRHFHV